MLIPNWHPRATQSPNKQCKAAESPESPVPVDRLQPPFSKGSFSDSIHLLEPLFGPSLGE
jgi:hypothetical protein